MHDHRLHRVAYGGPAALRVEAYLLGHREIGCAVDVDVTDTVEMREDWNGGACERRLQLLAAAWDDQVECFRMTLEDLNRLAIRVADEHHRIRIEIGLGDRVRDELCEQRVGAERLASAAQDHGVARLEPEHTRIDRDVGA